MHEMKPMPCMPPAGGLLRMRTMSKRPEIVVALCDELVQRGGLEAAVGEHEPAACLFRLLMGTVHVQQGSLMHKRWACVLSRLPLGVCMCSTGP